MTRRPPGPAGPPPPFAAPPPATASAKPSRLPPPSMIRLGRDDESPPGMGGLPASFPLRRNPALEPGRSRPARREGGARPCPRRLEGDRRRLGPDRLPARHSRRRVGADRPPRPAGRLRPRTGQRASDFSLADPTYGMACPPASHLFPHPCL